MLTWAVAYIIVKRNPWQPEGTGMSLLIAIVADVIIVACIFS